MGLCCSMFSYIQQLATYHSLIWIHVVSLVEASRYITLESLEPHASLSYIWFRQLLNKSYGRAKLSRWHADIIVRLVFQQLTANLASSHVATYVTNQLTFVEQETKTLSTCFTFLPLVRSVCLSIISDYVMLGHITSSVVSVRSYGFARPLVKSSSSRGAWLSTSETKFSCHSKLHTKDYLQSLISQIPLFTSLCSQLVEPTVYSLKH